MANKLMAAEDILKLIAEDDDDKLYDDDDSMHETTKRNDPPAKIRVRLNGKTYDRPTNNNNSPSPPTSPTPPPSPVTSSREWRRPRRNSPDRRHRHQSQSRRSRTRRPRRRRFQKFWPPHEYFELAKSELCRISSNPAAFNSLCTEWDELHGCGLPTFINMQGFIDTFGPALARRLFIFSIATNGTLRGIFENTRQSCVGPSQRNNHHKLFC
jgi:hypothetical protein